MGRSFLSVPPLGASTNPRRICTNDIPTFHHGLLRVLPGDFQKSRPIPVAVHRQAMPMMPMADAWNEGPQKLALSSSDQSEAEDTRLLKMAFCGWSSIAPVVAAKCTTTSIP